MTDIKCNSAEYLVDRFLNDIVRLSLVYVKNIDDAQDIAGQVFLTYLEKNPCFESELHAKNWLCKVAVNISKNHLRSVKNHVDYETLENVLTTEVTESDDKDSAVYRAVMSLKPIYSEVIHMYYYLEYTTAEIAGILNTSETSVRVRLKRARKLLENILKGGAIND